jgi:phosphoheptose isomerase
VKNSRAVAVQDAFDEIESLWPSVRREMLPALERACALLDSAAGRGARIFACGNGGSAAHARHLVAELVGQFEGRRRRVAASCLGADGVVSSSLANDFGFESALTQELESHARSGDVLVVFSTSGRSPNVVTAARRAKQLGVQVVVFTGGAPCPLTDVADVVVRAPSTNVSRVQELHQIAIHIVAEAVVTAG